MVQESDGSKEPRYTWGDIFLTLIPFAALAYAIALASGLPAETERQAERAFWLASLGGACAGALAWRYCPHLRSSRSWARPPGSSWPSWLATPCTCGAPGRARARMAGSSPSSLGSSCSLPDEHWPRRLQLRGLVAGDRSAVVDRHRERGGPTATPGQAQVGFRA